MHPILCLVDHQIVNGSLTPARILATDPGRVKRGSGGCTEDYLIIGSTTCRGVSGELPVYTNPTA